MLILYGSVVVEDEVVESAGERSGVGVVLAVQELLATVLLVGEEEAALQLGLALLVVQLVEETRVLQLLLGGDLPVEDGLEEGLLRSRMAWAVLMSSMSRYWR